MSQYSLCLVSCVLYRTVCVRLKTLLKTAKKQLREQGGAQLDSTLGSFRGDMSHRLEAESSFSRMKTRVQSQLQAFTHICSLKVCRLHWVSFSPWLQFCCHPSSGADGWAPVSVRARGVALLPAGGGEQTAEGEAGVCEEPEPKPRADGAQQEAAGGGGGRSAPAAGGWCDGPEPGRAVPPGDGGKSPTGDPTQTRGGQPLPAGRDSTWTIMHFISFVCKVQFFFFFILIYFILYYILKINNFLKQCLEIFFLLYEVLDYFSIFRHR